MMKAKPFVKWAGGKGRILKTLESYLPADFDQQKDVTYIEPFVGGGAMLFHMLQNHNNIGKVVINDINKDLIACYELIKDNPRDLITALSKLQSDYYAESHESRLGVYHEKRELYNSNSCDKVEQAGLFIFLNRTCFNGLYRVNGSGKFNVPMGRYKHPIICDTELIWENSRLLNSVDLIIRNGNYQDVKRNISKKNPNFFYFDPPYRPLNTTSYFKEYSNSPFGDAQQEQLKMFCDKINVSGTNIMLSNSDSRHLDGSSYFEELYQGYNFQRIYAPRCINAFAEKRVNVTEVLIMNYKNN